MTAREEVLGRIRTALAGDLPEAGPPAASASPAGGAAAPAYRTRGELGPPALLDLLADRLVDYRSHVRRTGPGQLLDTVRAALAERGARRAGRPLLGLDLPGLDQPAPGQAGTLDGVELITDGGLSAPELDRMDGVITRAAVAIAETGTIVLDAEGQGRRGAQPDSRLSPVPDRGRPGGRARPRDGGPAAPDRPLTWISGPSATSDIELDRVEGVHGPRTLEVILIDGGTG